MKVSVLIPAYNEEKVLPLTLSCLENQTVHRDQFEVIVIDDGSTDGTADFLKEFANNTQLQFHWETQKNQGQGNARNKALSKARGHIICLHGADTLAEPEYLEEHLKIHEMYPDEHIVGLGFYTWDPAVGITPLMYFLEHGGHQFAYDKASKMPTRNNFHVLDYRFFYTSTLSLKKSLFEKEKFLPHFTTYGWEDIELGYRLQKNHNMEILYNPKAKALHHDSVGFEQWKGRMTNIAKNGVLFEQQHPEVKVLPHGWKALIARCIAWKPIQYLCKFIARIIPTKSTYFLYYYSVMKAYTFEGMKLASLDE